VAKHEQRIDEFMTKYGVYQQINMEHKKPIGPLQPLLLLEWKWEEINMDLVTGSPRSRKDNDSIWVILDRLIKSTFFIPMKMTNLVDKLANLYVNEVVRLHRIPVSIVSNRDPRFTS
jgi:hypothetical protein